MPSYMTVIEANAYFNDRLNVRPWECANPDEQRRALAMATEIIDRLNFIGQKADELQDNQFPRGTDTVVPADVQKASAEIALALLDGVEPEMEFENLSLRSQGYGSVRSSFDKSQPDPNTVGGVPSITAWRYLSPYLRAPNTFDIFRIS